MERVNVLVLGRSVNISLQKNRPSTPPRQRVAELCSETAKVTWRELLSGRIPIRPHAEGLQAFTLRKHVVEALHQRHRLVDAHLDASQDHGHLVDLLDLFGVLGVALLALLHYAEQGLNWQIHLKLKQGFLELYHQFLKSCPWLCDCNYIFTQQHFLWTLIFVLLPPSRVLTVFYGFCLISSMFHILHWPSKPLRISTNRLYK